MKRSLISSALMATSSVSGDPSLGRLGSRTVPSCRGRDTEIQQDDACPTCLRVYAKEKRGGLDDSQRFGATALALVLIALVFTIGMNPLTAILLFATMWYNAVS